MPRDLNNLSVTFMAVEDLTPYDNNPRIHRAEQVEQIAASIREFGFTAPILINTKRGILAGHGRLEAAKRLGLERVPVIVLDGLSETQQRAYVIADNKLTENGEWDEAKLAEEIAAIQADGLEVGLLGFNDEELADLLEAQDLETLVPDETGESTTGVRSVYLVIGRERIPITEDEHARLISHFEKYAQKSGGVFGFANLIADALDGLAA